MRRLLGLSFTCLCLAAGVACENRATITGPSAMPPTSNSVAPAVDTTAAPVGPATGQSAGVTLDVENFLSETRKLHSQLAAVEEWLPPRQRPALPRLSSFEGVVRPLAERCDFFISLFAGLNRMDQAQMKALLRAFLTELKEFEDKMKKALADADGDDELPREFIEAAGASLSTAQSLRVVIAIAIGCTEGPC